MFDQFDKQTGTIRHHNAKPDYHQREMDSLPKCEILTFLLKGLFLS